MQALPPPKSLIMFTDAYAPTAKRMW